MASPRFEGGSAVASRPATRTSPRLISSSPAIMRRRVDLPHPEGPTKMMNSPASMARSTPLTTWVVPNHFSTDLSSMSAIIPSPPRQARPQRSR